MKKREWRNICLILLLLVIALGFGQTVKATEEHVPDGITMQTQFKPGYGESLGLFKKTIGRVVLIHTADTYGYWAENELPLFMKDRVVTPEEGLAFLQFLDESTISVAEDSELIINRFIFDPDKFDRSTFINLKSGKARFWVKKIEGYTRSEFKIKAKTMVAGVRGTNIVIAYNYDHEDDRVKVLRGQAGVLITESQEQIPVAEGEELVTKKGKKPAPEVDVANKGKKGGAAGDVVTVFVLEGEIEVYSTEDLTKDPRVVKAGEYVSVDEGGQVSPIEKTPRDVEAGLKNKMPMPSDQSVMSARIFKTEGTADSEKKDSQTQPTEKVGPAGQAAPEVAVKKETVPTEEPGVSPTAAVQSETAQLIPKEEIQQTDEAQKEKKKTEEEVVYAGGNILYPPDELVPPDPLAEFPEGLTLIDWPQESLSSPPGAAPAIYDVADGSSPSPIPVSTEALAPAISELPGLPPTPIP